MDIHFTLNRTYYKTGTNSDLLLADGTRICHAIELAWKSNKPRVSCIPEGTYEAVKYDSPKHGMVLLLKNVPSRDMIEVHASNWANGKDGKTPQLLGCIGPVTTLAGAGIGYESVRALAKVNHLAFDALDAGNKVYFHIKSTTGKPYDIQK